ncbi:MAG: efflux RND transporter periplasmic adaptor subunit [Deltaproteobacteria bacterium]|nr:efflux RND transporter periplasmic adaptor subunit [Deltaproteobacteria bacterium]
MTRVLLVVPAAILAAACPGDETLGSAPATVAAPAVETGDAGGVEPSAASPSSPAARPAGEMCEHGVLGAVCPKCHPALAAVYRAKGDWCAEHGFPESFCPTCRPESGGRPAVELAGDGAPADGSKVRLASRQAAALAGLQVAEAVDRPATVELVTTARVAYDSGRVARITAPAPGVVSELHVAVGSPVAVGAPLAVVRTAAVAVARARLDAAQARVDLAASTYRAERRLREQNIAAGREVRIAQAELADARAELAAARAELDILQPTADDGTSCVVRSPVAGVVTLRVPTVGNTVVVADLLFEVVDASTVWVELEIPETEVGRVTEGRPVVVTVDGLPGREFHGTLGWLAPALDPRTRTVAGRVVVANTDGVLRANMFARARIALEDPRPAVLVPVAAVQRARGASLVFVRLAEDLFEVRRVAVGPAAGGLVPAQGRLRAGEEVVTVGAFLLKTETLKDSIGGGCCEVD